MDTITIGHNGHGGWLIIIIIIDLNLNCTKSPIPRCYWISFFWRSSASRHILLCRVGFHLGVFGEVRVRGGGGRDIKKIIGRGGGGLSEIKFL